MFEIIQGISAIAVGGLAGFRGIRTDCGRNAVYVIAAPRIEGILDGRSRAAEVVLHCVGILIGAIAIGLVTIGISQLVAFPSGVTGALVLTLALAGCVAIFARGDMSTAAGSAWRVPRNWAAVGHSTYAAVFGVALGAGFITALPSVGLLGIFLWAVADAKPVIVLVVFVAFALGRVLPFLAIAERSRRTGVFPVGSVDFATKIARGAFATEVAGLGILAVALLSR